MARANPSAPNNAYDILRACERIRDLSRGFCAAVAKELSDNDFWVVHALPSIGRSDPNDPLLRVARFKEALDQLVDEQMDQRKIEAAEEQEYG